MKIAVCDDDKAAREHIVSLIKEQIQNAEIMTFATGEEMLKVKNTFDISFLDVEMREVSGMDVANHIRQKEHGSTRSIIIFVTGYEKYNREKILDSGCSAFALDGCFCLCKRELPVFLGGRNGVHRIH